MPMENDKIIEVLSSWNFWNKEQDIGIYRKHYLEKLDNFIDTGQIIAITGARRSGKSTLMKQFIKKMINSGKNTSSFLYVNFEEPKFSDYLNLEFIQQIYDAYLEIVKPSETPYLLFDEIQNVPKWEKFVRGLHEKKEANIIISGSTSKLMSKELGTLLTGRWMEIKTYPLSFIEFLNFKQLNIQNKLDVLSQKTKIKQLLREYLKDGGFPLVVLKNEKEEILNRYFDDIIGKDIAERHRIRKVEKLRSLARFYLTNVATSISYRKIAKFIGLSLDSTERISSYMEDAYFIFFIRKFSYSLKEQEINPRKVYGLDPGLINMVGFKFSDNIGRLYENIVFLNLVRKGKEIYYYKNRYECDFIIKKGKKVEEIIQVCYNLEKDTTKKREIEGLLEGSRDLKCSNLYIITEDFESEQKIEGKKIKFIPLWKWLLT